MRYFFDVASCYLISLPEYVVLERYTLSMEAVFVARVSSVHLEFSWIFVPCVHVARFFDNIFTLLTLQSFIQSHLVSSLSFPGRPQRCHLPLCACVLCAEIYRAASDSASATSPESKSPKFG